MSESPGPTVSWFLYSRQRSECRLNLLTPCLTQRVDPRRSAFVCRNFSGLRLGKPPKSASIVQIPASYCGAVATVEQRRGLKGVFLPPLLNDPPGHLQEELSTRFTPGPDREAPPCRGP